jgi:hypothetical protein
MEHTYRRQIFEHLGLVAGMCDALGMGDGIDKATQQHPAMRDLPVGEAVKAMGRHGLGCITQALSLVPRFFPHKPTARLMAPRVAPAQLTDEALGRALETLDDYGVTALSRRMAATAATRRGWAPTCAHLARTSLHVDGRYHREEEPDAAVMHITRGDRRAHRPDRTQVRLALMGAPQAGMPVLMPPLRGHRSEAHEVGQVVKDPRAQLPTTSGTTSLVAERALSTADTLQTLAEPQSKGMPRGPATVRDAPAALTPAEPQTMAPLTGGYRAHGLTSTEGGGAPRWGLVYAEHRHAPAQRPVDKQLRTQGQRAGAAFQPLGRMTWACDAEAQQALATLTPGVPATGRQAVAARATPRDRTRGRPRQGAPPAPIISPSEGARASALAARPPRVDQPRGFIRATHARDETLLPPQDLVTGSKGQAHAERGFRCRTDPPFCAASRSLKPPDRGRAFVMVMPVCVLV